MIRRLRRRYILIAMGSLAAVLLILVAGINLFNYRDNVSRLNGTAAWLITNDLPFPDGAFPPADSGGPRDFPGRRDPESVFTTRYFTVYFAADGTLQSADLTHIAAVDEQQALSYAARVLEGWPQKETAQGFLGQYRYQVGTAEQQWRIIFLDAGRELSAMRSLLLTSALVALGCFVAVLIPVIWLTRRATAPVAESIEKQKRFITDAGHELKTPLTILSANAEVLAMSGDNEWLQSIRNQLERLKRLVNDLVQLSRLDEDAPPPKERFSLSAAVLDTAAPFSAPAERRGLTLTLDVPPEVDYTGSEPALRRLVSLLCDNAVKYCSAGGAVAVSLRGGKRPVLTVRNSFDKPPELDLSRLFDRFYRGDPARSPTGSFGLGLSVARAVAESHGGSISAAMADKEIVFTVQL